MSTRPHLFVLSLLALSLAACSVAAEDVGGGSSAIGDKHATEPGGEDECAELHDGKPHFGYDDEGHGGPDDWDEIKLPSGELAYPACAGPGQQSPIALPAPRVSADASRGAFDLGPQTLAWSPRIQVASLINNGHTWLANVDPVTNSTIVERAGGATADYTLAQFHFHAPSEHTIDGKHLPLEAHFVHLAPEGTQPFAEVIGVMFEESDRDNPELAKIWDRFDRCPQSKPTPLAGGTALEISQLLPEDRTYFQYDGSLTAPPCTRTVRFRLLTTPVKASKKQIAKFVKALGETNRPTQRRLPETKVTLHQP